MDATGRGEDDVGRAAAMDLLAHDRVGRGILTTLSRSQDAVYVKDREGRLLMTNGVTGVPTEELIGRTAREVFPPEMAEEIDRRDQEVMSQDVPVTSEELVVLGDEARTYLSTKVPLHDPDGRVIGVVGISSDITERIDTERELRRREALLAEAQELAHLGSWEWDVQSGEVIWSDECYRIVGREPEDFVPTFDSFLASVHPDDRKRMRAAIDAGLSGSEYRLDHRVTRPDGEVRFVSCNGKVEFDVDGTPLRMVGAVLDVTERKETERELEWQALHDPLTHLPNRTLLLDRLAQALRAADRHGEIPGVLFLDIDRFKSVNDELGHEAGDELLVAAGRRLRDVLRASDTLARVGGDEFVAVCGDVSTHDELLASGERMRSRFSDPFELGGRARQVTVSIGVALAGGPDDDPGRLIQRADRAMYAAKQHGRDRVEGAGDAD